MQVNPGNVLEPVNVILYVILVVKPDNLIFSTEYGAKEVLTKLYCITSSGYIPLLSPVITPLLYTSLGTFNKLM